MRKKLKKRKKNTELKKAMNRCWKALRLAVIRRDGGRCQLGFYKLSCSDILQGDHFVPRAKMSTHFDIRNITCLCSSHNWMKSIDGMCAYYVGKQVELREGERVVQELLEISKKTKNWRVEELDELAKEYDKAYLSP